MKKGESRPDLYRAKIKTCPICKKDFRAVKDTEKRKQIYCSRACWQKSRGNPIIEIICPICGTGFYNRNGRKKYCSHKCYSKALESIKTGENSHFWRGGKTKESKRIKTTAEYKKWRAAVFSRDLYKCVKCGSKENIEAHHIKEQSKYPELRFDINNGMTLCHICHKQTDNYGIKAKTKKNEIKRK